MKTYNFVSKGLCTMVYGIILMSSIPANGQAKTSLASY